MNPVSGQGADRDEEQLTGGGSGSLPWPEGGKWDIGMEPKKSLQLVTLLLLAPCRISFSLIVSSHIMAESHVALLFISVHYCSFQSFL